MAPEKFELQNSSKEIIALQLTQNIAAAEGIEQHHPHFRKIILDLYAECLDAVSGGREFQRTK